MKRKIAKPILRTMKQTTDSIKYHNKFYAEHNVYDEEGNLIKSTKGGQEQ